MPATPSMTSVASSAMRDGILASRDTPIVFDCVRAAGPDGIRFDVWYCNTHLPALAQASRAHRLRRYAVPSRAAYVAIGEIAALPAGDEGQEGMDTMPSTVTHHERFFGEPLGTMRRRDAAQDVIESAVAYPAFLRVPEDSMEEIGRWYSEEHLPVLLACPQWVMTRRFRITGARGLAFTHVAVHYLTDLRALESPERDAARNTPWRDSLIARGWFAPEYRVCYRAQDF